jgi:hypothetical protein
MKISALDLPDVYLRSPDTFYFISGLPVLEFYFVRWVVLRYHIVNYIALNCRIIDELERI